MRAVTEYLEIQQARFGKRLRYDLDVEPAAASMKVPPFAVQTLVENAVKHVAGRRQEGVAICLRAGRSDGDLVVEVTDNGPGFAEDALKAGHLLDDLQGRLRALYGSRAGLEFRREASGMTVQMRVPAT